MAHYFGGSSELRQVGSAAVSAPESLDALIARSSAQVVGLDRSGGVWVVARSDEGVVGRQLVPWTDADGNVGWRIAAAVFPSECRDG